MNLKVDTEVEYQGLFGYNKGTIKNVGVEGDTITLAKTAGVIAGYSEGIIENCYNTADIISENGKFIGGIVGIVTASKISNCYNMGNMTCETNEKFGSACGIAALGKTSVSDIVCCFNTGNIKLITTEENCRVAGITNECCNVDSCYNKGNLQLTDTSDTGKDWHCVAGIDAQENNGTIKNCYNVGTITLSTITNNRRDASILGHAFGVNVVVDNCFAEDNLNCVCKQIISPTLEENIHSLISIDGNKGLLAEKLGSYFKKSGNDDWPILFWQ